MFRELLGVAALLALPTLLAAQAPVTPAKPAEAHGIATQVQGDVIMMDEVDGQNNDVGVNETDGDNNQEGVDEADGPNNDGAFNQEGVDEPDGINNDVDVVGDQSGQDEGSAEDPALVVGQNSRIGSHRP